VRLPPFEFADLFGQDAAPEARHAEDLAQQLAQQPCEAMTDHPSHHAPWTFRLAAGVPRDRAQAANRGEWPAKRFGNWREIIEGFAEFGDNPRLSDRPS
jgi:hypothetical protein